MNQIKLIAACFLLAVCSCKDNVADKPASVTTTTTATTEDSSVTTAPPQNKPDIAVAAQAIKAELQKRSVKSQVFSSDSCHGLIIGKAGTLISVDKAALETMDGKPVTGDVVVELKELMDKSAFMSADAPTVSNGSLLVSGGSYFIGMQSNGQDLKLRPGKKLNVRLPKAGDGMSLFYGQRDNNGAINWKPADKPLTRSAATGATTNYKAPDGQNYWLTNNDKVTRWIARLEAAKKDLKGHSISSQEYGGKAQTMKASDFRSARGIDMDGSDSLRIKSEIALLQDSLAKEGKMVAMAATLYEQIDVASLGWINCDRFHNAPNVMDLAYNIVGKDSVGYAKVFVLFHDINSLMEGSYRSDATQSFIRKVPVGSNVTLIAMSIKGKKVFLSKVRTVTTPGAVVALNMNEATENEMKNLFK